MTMPPSSSLLATRIIQGRTVNASFSASREDERWDDFLRGVSVGQFQQSTLWAQSKQSQGWQCWRVTLEQEGAVVGGFQAMWKRTRIGNVAYINKGPALAARWPELESFALDILMGLAESHKLAVIIAQAPDHHASLADAMQKRGFVCDHYLSVIDATMWVDLSSPEWEWEKTMSASNRKKVRRSQNQSVTICEGEDGDIPLFFDLMVSSCQRQGAAPNPPTLEATTQLVQSFRKHSESRIFFAVCEGEKVAAVLDLKFGKRYTSWKKGWDGRHGKLYPNVLLTCHSVKKAREMGCLCFDFAGVERPIAEALLAGQPLTQAQIHHYDSYKLGFGGQPRLLPPALIYCRNPLLRFAYRQLARPALAQRLKRLLRLG